MSNPIEKLKKLKGRSWSEIRTRSIQTFAAYSEQFGLSGKLPSDDELRKLLVKGDFDDKLVTSESLINKFFEKGKHSFFPGLLNKEATLEAFGEIFGESEIERFVERATKITEDKINVLGYPALHFGDPVDWHYEPVSDIQAPMKHWKLFDDLDSKETGDKKIIWEFNRHQHFFVLGIAYLHTKNEKFAAAFVRHLDSWMVQNPPAMGINWSSSLEVSLRSMSWLWAFHFFKDSQSFTPGVFSKALKYLFLHGMHLEQYLSTYFSPNTHLTGEALGLYYLGTQLSFLDRAEHWKSVGRKILISEIDKQVLADGVYFEQSTWYQRYTADFYLQFLVLLRLNGDDIGGQAGETASSRTQALLDFLMFATRPDGTTPIIGDDDGGRCLPLSTCRPDDFRGTLATGAIVFKRGDYKYVSSGVSQEALWLFGREGTRFFELLETYYPEKNSEGFTDGGYFVMRDGWTKTDNYLLFDAGQIGSLNGGHGHADTLAFELAAGGKTMLVDPGTFTYHESKELRDSFRSSNAHNTLAIDKESSSEMGGKFSWKSKAEASVKSWLSFDRFDFVEASHDGYERLDEAITEHTRSILFLRNEYWIMRDFVDTRGAHSYQQNFHFDTRTKPTASRQENGFEYLREPGTGGSGMALFTFGDNGEWKEKEGWVSRCYGERKRAPYFQYSSQGNGPQEFFTFMIPYAKGEENPGVYETNVRGGRAFVIEFRGYQDLFVFADGSEPVRTEIFDTDFRFLWARLSNKNDLPEEFVMIDGKRFTLDGRVVIEYPNQLDCAIARRFGKKLHVRTGSDVFSVSLPQKHSKTFIVKTPNDPKHD